MARAVSNFVVAAALVATTAYATLYGSIDAPPPIHSDGYSYFVYLPSVFIYRDFTLERLATNGTAGRIRRTPGCAGGRRPAAG